MWHIKSYLLSLKSASFLIHILHFFICLAYIDFHLQFLPQGEYQPSLCIPLLWMFKLVVLLYIFHIAKYPQDAVLAYVSQSHSGCLFSSDKHDTDRDFSFQCIWF